VRYGREMGVHHGFLGRDGLPTIRLSPTPGSVKVVSAGSSAAALLEGH